MDEQRIIYLVKEYIKENLTIELKYDLEGNLECKLLLNNEELSSDYIILKND